MPHAAVLSVGFAAARTADVRSTDRLVALGAGYGVVLWVVLAVLVMSVWLSTVGSPANLPFPNVDTSLVGHVVYGAVAGSVFPAVRDL